MACRVSRQSGPFIALALASMGLVACSSTTPTAPSSLSASDAALPAVTASESSASVTTGDAQVTAAAAKTIKITQGTLAVQSLVAGSVLLRGSHGFSFDGRVTSGLEPSTFCSVFDPCQPGATVPFMATWVGTDIPGTVRLQGDEFPVGSADSGSMYIELAGSFVAPAHLTDTASVTVPFTSSGLLSRGYPFPAVPLTGSGEVTFRLEWQTAIGGWGIRFTSFDFGRGRSG